MLRRHVLPLLLPLLLLAGCREQESTTAPAEPGGPLFDHTAGHKVVNSLADPGNGICNATQCTLREAINTPGSTEISFAPDLAGTITLARPGAGGGTLEIDHTLSITGPAGGITIRRRSTDPEFRIFRIHSGETVRLANLTLRNGKADGGGGGGIVNFGTLSLTHCVVVGNSASVGGGIANRGGETLTLTNSTVADNIGGGILNLFLGTLVLTNTTVADNTGIGISDNRGTATLTNVRLVGNSGGGISTFLGRFTIARSTVARNSTSFDGGGIFNNTGTFTITRSTVAGNSAAGSGGGISNSVNTPRLAARVTLTNSTVSGNSAGFGGGIDNAGGGNSFARVTLTNSTVTRNSATQEGGGIREGSGSDDSGVGLTNTLVAQNRAPAGPDVFDGSGTVGGRFNLIGDGSGSFITNTNGNHVGSASAPIDPKLGPLANNGGPTRTHALLSGSPAIDAASSPDCPGKDQRGVSRPQGSGCDIGSYERAE